MSTQGLAARYELALSTLQTGWVKVGSKYEAV